MLRLVSLIGLISLVACSTKSSTGGSSSSGAGGSTGSSSGSGGSAGSASATVNGTIAGRSFSPAYAVAAKGIDDPAYPDQVTIVIANVDDLCGLIQATEQNPGLSKANLLEMGLVLGATDADAGAVAPGTYTPSVNPGTDAFALTAGYSSLDANCMGTSGEESAGTVTLTSVGAVYDGTFDVTFGSEHVTGTFAAPFCDTSMAADGGATGDGGMVCEP